ncbi:Type IV pilus retraction ATPase PilT2 [Rubrobacter xylanophilus DSM 9941]|uniref:type IV pilus twitching motility protein PilT n=1 Tax=Rubrobacter xylanophilus TaxID=49319 RepID=UPI001C643CEC|nr:type IV pilus twitching motility protein PilT [Rubrobacter xylanophilus]QYJ14407.1 Type IV pilus retraction ATPase PilT2 [Rubrobacter xylanophilus DSM 9941]
MEPSENGAVARREISRIEVLLEEMVSLGGSDLHLKVGSPPVVRVDGLLQRVEGFRSLLPEDTVEVLSQILPAALARDFEVEGEADFSYSVEGLGRFRVNAFRQRGSVSLAMRFVPFEVPRFEELGLPEVVGRLAREERGIVLVTGTTGSGKSTTLAAMIDLINRSEARHIVTVEDPIEFLHRDRRSIVNQREVGMDTASFSRALRRVLRQDPDVILIGEIRDAETARIALSAAETGHLVLSTLHTVDATETVNRLIDLFPPHEREPVRSMLAGTLRGIVGQRLLRARDGGRVAACEVLVATGRIREFILDETKTVQLQESIAEGGYYGMQTYDQALLELVREGRVDYEEALRASSQPQNFRLMVRSLGIGN